MQPNFSFDSIDYSDRLSKEYLDNNNPFRTLIDEVGFVPGKDLIFGSDGMPHGIYTALKAALFPPLENQQLSIAELKAGYCMETDEAGTIEFSIDYNNRDIVDIKIDVDVN